MLESECCAHGLGLKYLPSLSLWICVYVCEVNQYEILILSLNSNAIQLFVDSQDRSDMRAVPCSLFPLGFCSAAHRAITATLQRERETPEERVTQLQRMRRGRGQEIREV